MIATAEDVDVAAGGVSQISADRGTKDTTFYVGSEGVESRNIVTIHSFPSGTKTLAYDLTEKLRQGKTTLNTVVSVTVVKGEASITTSNLRKDRSQMEALLDIAFISAANA